ncbi:cyclic nucleotide-binding domain-containing protein [Salinispirillum marinum]|uniref:Cyclic nucleotide-binding domain-containing protein n=2 Tax=Saccharospirillaceae TaxID=255527 RepID=A0ABV8BI72_9GAMM
MTLFEKMLFLGRTDLFSALPAEDLELIALATEVIEVEADQWLFHQGDVGDRMYLVVSGSVTLWVQRPNGLQPVTTRGAGDFFGEMALLDDARRSASAQCAEHCQFLVLDKESFVQLVMDYPAIALAVFKFLCALIRGGDKD